MALLDSTWPTLIDVANRLDRDGKIPVIAEILTKSNPILDDMTFIEGNEMTGHRGPIRTGLPAVAWKLLNYGTPSSKSTTKIVLDSCGMLEAWSQIDKQVAVLNGNTEAFRMSEDVAFIEAMAQEMATTLFYGNTETNPEKFLGLDTRFSSTSAGNGAQVILGGAAGGQTDNASIWLITHGERVMTGIYPKGSMAGLEVQNLGEQTVRDSSGNLMQALVSHYIWKMGIHVRDWGGIARLCNLDISVLEAAPDDATHALINKMIKLIAAIPARLENYGRRVLYMNRRIWVVLTQAAMAKTSSQLTIQQLENGKFVTHFMGIPIRVCDSLTVAETLRS